MVFAVAIGCLKFLVWRKWEEGEFLGQQDSACLQQAAVQGWRFVTYDRRTIPPLPKSWAEEERKHGGVIFLDEKTISPSDTGSLVRALSNLLRKIAKWDQSSLLLAPLTDHRNQLCRLSKMLSDERASQPQLRFHYFILRTTDR
jgi:hypothetical protein